MSEAQSTETQTDFQRLFMNALRFIMLHSNVSGWWPYVLPVAYQMHSRIAGIGSQIKSISPDLTLITHDFTEDHPAYL